MGTPTEPQAYSVAAAGIFLGLGATTVKRLVRAGILPVRKSGRRSLILRTDLTAYLESLPTSGRELSRGAGGRFVVHHDVSKTAMQA